MGRFGLWKFSSFLFVVSGVIASPLTGFSQTHNGNEANNIHPETEDNAGGIGNKRKWSGFRGDLGKRYMPDRKLEGWLDGRIPLSQQDNVDLNSPHYNSYVSENKRRAVRLDLGKRTPEELAGPHELADRMLSDKEAFLRLLFEKLDPAALRSAPMKSSFRGDLGKRKAYFRGDLGKRALPSRPRSDQWKNSQEDNSFSPDSLKKLNTNSRMREIRSGLRQSAFRGDLGKRESQPSEKEISLSDRNRGIWMHLPTDDIGNRPQIGGDVVKRYPSFRGDLGKRRAHFRGDLG